MDNTMKRSATYLLGVLLLLAAGSCSVQKKCKAPQLDMPAEIVAGQSDTLTLSDRKWWEVYTDTTLCRLIGRTLDRNRNMLSAEARIRQLEELYRVSKAVRLPSLGGLAAADYETNDYYGEAHKGDAEFDVKATLSWEADLWGNLRWAKRKGAAEYLASVEAARAMQMTLVAEVATAYFELVALDHELGVVRRTVETREESVRQAKLRFEGGLTSETAYQQAKVELASASALIPDLELRIAQKENQISVLAGDYPSRVARSKMDMNVRMPDSLPVGLPSTLLQRRPDVRQAEQNLKAAMASAGMAYADRFPRLTISLTGGLENDALKGLINSPFSYAAGNLTAPLFAFGSKRAKYRAALAAYDQARLAYEQKVLEVFREVNDAVTAYRNMRRTAELKFNLKEAARQYVVLAKLQYINGVIRYIDVLDAQRKFFDAQVEESKAVRNEHLALVGLYKALGGGWQPSDAEKWVDRKWSTLFLPQFGPDAAQRLRRDPEVGGDVLQRHVLQQFGAFLHQRPVALLGPRSAAREHPVFERQELLLEKPPPEIGRSGRSGEKGLQVGFGDAVKFSVAHRLDGDFRNLVAHVAPRRKERLALAGEPDRDIRAVVEIVPQPDAAAHDVETGIPLALTDDALPLAEHAPFHQPDQPQAVRRGQVVFPAEFLDKRLHALQV